MEEKIINMNQFLGAAQGDQEHMLGKFLYFSLANLLVDKDELSSLCESMGIPYTGSTRLSLGDAFRSATGDIRERIPVTVDGETNIYLAYCRDNKRTAGVFSRELVKETLNRETNRYEKLANISCGKNDGMFRCDNLVLDDAVDVQGCCRKAEELFELYQRCANRKQIETICVNFLRGMEATKLSVTGHMYFVPRTFMERVDIFEDFITLLSGLNKKQTPLVVNSFYIIDDAKQRDKMTEEFYLAVKKEIAAYQEKCDYWKGRLLLEQAKQDHDRCNDYKDAAIASFCATNVTERFDHLPENADEDAAPQLSPPQWLSAIELLRYPDREVFRVDRRMVFQTIYQKLTQQVEEVQSDRIQIHNERYRLTKKDVRSNMERCLDMVKVQFPDKEPLMQEMIRSIR